MYHDRTIMTNSEIVPPSLNLPPQPTGEPRNVKDLKAFGVEIPNPFPRKHIAPPEVTPQAVSGTVGRRPPPGW
jgi:hypothetical protein